MARDLSGLRYELDFPLKFRKSFQRQTVVWITAAVEIVRVLPVIAARTKKIKVNAKAKTGSDPKEGILGAGLALGAVKLAATLLKPVLMNFVSKKMSGYAAGTSRKR
jgi:hypothetical protein